MKYAYYPGCSLEATAKEFDNSTHLVADALGIEMQEIPDWNCCGASSAHNTNHFLGVALPARNLGLAEKMGAEIIIAPCAACYNRMRSAEVTLKEDSKLREKINAELENPFTGNVTVKSALEVFSTPEFLEVMKSKLCVSLDNLKPACYYGCLLTRPAKVTGWDDAEQPQSLDNTMKALGANPVDWYYKNECCGASFGLSKSEIVVKMTGDILRNAKAQGANSIVTACPLCFTNLEMRQIEASRKLGEDLTLPVFYFTELIGLAMELPGIKKCFSGHLVDVNPALDLVMGAGV